MYLTNDIDKIKRCNIFIITVPTPIDKNKKPDFYPLLSATKNISSYIKKNDIIIYESTVYPGVTEELCSPLIERESGLILNKDFYLGYSPERINPGDKKRTITKIKKVTSGSTPEIAKKVDALYNEIISEGTYMTSSIKVAEAAKVIENAQRDINIAFVNELSKVFNRMDIDTNEVLNAACTKWNFLDFRPGLVGGHCIGVDPYYLASKSIELGYFPKIILGGRELNDSMSNYVANEAKNLLESNAKDISSSSILILGITFKENCPDTRNSKVFDLINHLVDYKAKITIFDPYINVSDIKQKYNLNISNTYPNSSKFDLIIIAVAHDEFKLIDFGKIKKESTLIYDLKNLIGNIADKRL